MPNLYDLAYTFALVAAGPFWLARRKTRQKVRQALLTRMGSNLPPPEGRSSIFIHAVSLGEMNATRELIHRLALERPQLHFVVSTTTDTGFARAQELYGADPRVRVIHYPLDFSRAIRRVLDLYHPCAVVLMELEVWPNFVLQCHRREIPVVLVNGRLTESSFLGYQRLRPLLRRTFARLTKVCAQDDTYAQRFIALGVPPDRVQVTGTMKFDNAQVAGSIAGAAELALSVGLHFDAAPIWVCGSTGPGEEAIILRQFRQLRQRHSQLRLVIVPRHPQRFDEVARLIGTEGYALVRRSQPRAGDVANELAIVLGDTMGELRKFYSVATIVFVGRSLVDLGPRQHGSDMIEPAALGKPVITGPFTQNFSDAMSRLRAADAVRVVSNENELGEAVGYFLDHPDDRQQIGVRAQEVVRREQGATDRHVRVILESLSDLAKADGLESDRLREC